MRAIEEMNFDDDDAWSATTPTNGSLGLLLEGHHITGLAPGTPAENLLQIHGSL